MMPSLSIQVIMYPRRSQEGFSQTRLPWADAELLAQFGNRRVAAYHGSLSHSHLGFRQGESLTTLATAGGLRSRHGAFPDEFALKLGQRGKDTERQSAGSCCRVDPRTPACECLQANVAIGKKR